MKHLCSKVLNPISSIGILTAFFILLFITTAKSQIAESFESGIVATGAPVTHLPAGWSYVRLNGTNGLPNCADTVSLITDGNHPALPSIFNGTKALRYNTRNIAYPGNNIFNTQGNERVMIVTKPLDWSGRDTATGANLNKIISLRFYRDVSVTGGVNLINDNMQVYINSSPDTIGGVLLTDVTTGANTIPRSATLAPAYAGGGWQLLTYQLPAQVPGPGGGKFDTTSTAYVILKFTSNPVGIGGNNMFVDSMYVPEWPTNMVATHAELIYQNTSTTSPGATNNVILGVKVVTKGSLNPQRLDRMVFYTNGSSNFIGDVAASRCYYTHDTSYWYANGTQLPHLAGLNTIQPMDFGYWGNPCTVTSPAAFQLRAGTENYVWLVYDINNTPLATPGNYVDADFGFFQTGSDCSKQLGSIPTTLAGGVLIDISYAIPTYIIGTKFLNYYLNDFTCAVELLGDNGTAIDNWYHDLTVGPPCGVNCDRFSAHPPDYTQFPQVNLGINKNRFVQITKARGKRTGTAPYTLKAAPGTWFGANNIRIFIDWNKDGDFTDVFMKPGGIVTDSIREDFLCSGCTNGQWSLAQGNMNSPFTGAHGTWTIDVPDLTDIVKDRAKAGSNGPMLIGPIRLRVREVFASSNISPTATYVFGEVEDYTVNVIDDCPPIGANVCKWLGTNTEWNDPVNWCPLVPTINDIAIIPALSGTSKYPIIDSGVVAVCRSLKIENGAQVSIDCPYSTGLANDTKGSLRVADSLIIGVGTIASTSVLKINSDFKTISTVPSASSVPPAGNGYVPQSFFQVTPNLKIQISYSANELYNVFGWRPGDVIDSITFLFKSTTGAAVTFPNFRIVKWETSYYVNWSNPLSVADTAVRSGHPAVIGAPQYVLGNSTSGVTINMNLPNNGISYITIPLNGINQFIWNGNNLVLSFEYWSSSNVGKGNYMLYTEASGIYNVLGLKSNTGAATWNNINSGYGLSGYGRSLVSPFNNANVKGTGTPDTYGASNQRPRLSFSLRRPYNKFPITVGKAFVNNNNSGSPAGANGFIAGNSKVVFDPSIRSGVSSPGLATMTNAWNPTLQTQFLSTTNDTLSITSGRYALGGTGYQQGTSSTVFNELEIKAATSGASSIVKQGFNTYSDSLTMTSGELNLNKRIFTLQSSDPNSLASNGGWIRSEDSSTGHFESRFLWQIGTSTGQYAVPFGNSVTSVFPLRLYATAGDFGDVEFATYGTPNTNNTKLPVLPVAVTSMNTNPSPVVDATP